MSTPTATPRTDAAYFAPGATMYSLAGEMKDIERELARLRAEVERLTKQIKDDNRSYGCEIRDPNGTIWEQAAKDHARAERAEAMLADPQQLHAHCLRTLNEGQIAHLFGGRMTEIVNSAERAEADAAAYLKRAESFSKLADEAEADCVKWQRLLLMSRDDREANLLSALKLMVSKFDAFIDSEYCGTDLLAEQLAQADFAREVIREAEGAPFGT